MAEYLVTLADGQQFHMDGNFVEPSSAISVCFHDPKIGIDWQITPFQTAAAHHDPEEAANLIAFRYATDDHDCTQVQSVKIP